MKNQSDIEHIRNNFCRRLSLILNPLGYIETKGERFCRETPECRLSTLLQISFWQGSKSYSVQVWMHIYHFELERLRDRFPNPNKIFNNSTYQAGWEEVCRPNNLGSDTFNGLNDVERVIDATAKKLTGLVIPFLDDHSTLDSLQKLFEAKWKRFPRLLEVAEIVFMIHFLHRDMSNLEKALEKMNSVRMVSEPCSKRQACLEYGAMLLSNLK